MSYKTENKKHSLPEKFEQTLELTLNELNTTLRKKIKLAESVLEISKMYNTTTGSKTDIWNSNELSAAYLAYYLPLNFIRLSVVLGEAVNNGMLQNIKTVFDIGSGPGTAEFAFYANKMLDKFDFINFEAKKNAIELHQKFFHNHRLRKPKHIDVINEVPKNAIGVFSYVVNELEDTTLLKKFDSLIIIEPSTYKDARKLMELRAELISSGYHILAPCTHTFACPLLKHSKKDWCHFRVFWERPLWMQQLEQPLGFNNRTLTYSYILASKVHSQVNQNTVRVIGDTLDEKGKTKQAICRGEDREFVSWLHRYKEINNIARGAIIELPALTEAKGTEVRITQNPKILWQP